MDGKPLSAGMHRSMMHRVLPTRSNTPICCGVLVAANSWIIPIAKQDCRNSPPGVLAALVGAPTNDVTAEGYDRRADEQLRQLKTLGSCWSTSRRRSTWCIRRLPCNVLVAVYGHWREGPHQVPVAQLERPDDLVVGCLGVSKLLSFHHGANAAVRDSPRKCDTSAVSLAWNIQALCVEMTQPPVPHSRALATAFIPSPLASYRSALMSSTHE